MNESRMKKLFPVAAILLLSGCFGFVPFQPNSYQYERWSKSGASELEVRIAMLECGYPSPFGVNDRGLGVISSANDIALMIKCKKNNGFFYDDKTYNFCDGFRELPACQPGAFVPKRESSTRINSPFCKKYVNADACRP
jgi:hypothetical protein